MSNYDEHKYDDIINLPHHVSKLHPRMSIQNRAAQFAPFSALTGYDSEIREIVRLTDKKIELEDEMKEEINRKLQEIKKDVSKGINVNFTYFIKDKLKEGGAYITTYGIVKKIDEANRIVVLDTQEEIPIDDITEFYDTNGENQSLKKSI